jgi:hypothetical protein
MYCQYKCVDCGDWHPLSNIPTSELYGAMISFIVEPPPPFDSKTWEMIFVSEIRRRGGRIFTIRL